MALGEPDELKDLQTAQGLLDDEDFRSAQSLAEKHGLSAATPGDLERLIGEKIRILMTASEPTVARPKEPMRLHQRITVDYAQTPPKSALASFNPNERRQLVIALFGRCLSAALIDDERVDESNATSVMERMERALRLEDLPLLHGIYLSTGLLEFAGENGKRILIGSVGRLLVTNGKPPLVLQCGIGKKDSASKASTELSLEQNCHVLLQTKDLYSNDVDADYILTPQYRADYDSSMTGDTLFLGSQKYAFAPNAIAARLARIAAGNPAFEDLPPRRAGENGGTGSDLDYSLARLTGSKSFEHLLSTMPWEANLLRFAEHDLAALIEAATRGQRLGQLELNANRIRAWNAGFRN